MTQRVGKPSVPAGDDLLPPVEPPSAGFIIQLFVVPALIVLVIVSVWLTFNWLVRRTSPEAMVKGLEQGPSVARWQRASELADMLRNKRFAEFKRNAEAANHLARILDREIDQAGTSDGMRKSKSRCAIFWPERWASSKCPMESTCCSRRPKRIAIQASSSCGTARSKRIAVRAYNLHQLEPPQELAHPDLDPALARLAADEDPRIRSQTAYALGQIGTPAAMKQLEALVDDPDPDTRYNAAVGLAHHGNAKAVETLAEMLDLDELLAMKAETDERRSGIQAGRDRGQRAAGRGDARRAEPERRSILPVIESLERTR